MSRKSGAIHHLLQTIRIEHGRPCRLDLHIERLVAAGAHFGFPVDVARIRAEVNDACPRSAGSATARVLLDFSGRVRVEISALPNTAAGPLPVVLAAHAVKAPVAFLRHKTTRRDHFAPFAANTPDAFDTLLWNAQGEITEFTRGNVILELSTGKKVSPPLHCGLLDGVGRACEVSAGRVREATVRIDELAAARRIWFVNALRGHIPVHLRDQ